MSIKSSAESIRGILDSLSPENRVKIMAGLEALTPLKEVLDSLTEDQRERLNGAVMGLIAAVPFKGPEAVFKTVLEVVTK